VVVDRRALPRAPDEADDREARGGIAVEQILAIAIGIGRGVAVGQPVVYRDQVAQQRLAVAQDHLLIACPLHQRLDLADEPAQRRQRLSPLDPGHRSAPIRSA
jgi:hypothetical protein